MFGVQWKHTVDKGHIPENLLLVKRINGCYKPCSLWALLQTRAGSVCVIIRLF